MSKPTYEDLEAQIKHLAAEKEKFAVECAATKIAIAYLKSGRHDFTLNTTATDAFLAEVRAQGVDGAIAELNQLAERSEKEAPIAAEHHRSAALYLQLFAAQLRKGLPE